MLIDPLLVFTQAAYNLMDNNSVNNSISAWWQSPNCFLPFVLINDTANSPLVRNAVANCERSSQTGSVFGYKIMRYGESVESHLQIR